MPSSLNSWSFVVIAAGCCLASFSGCRRQYSVTLGIMQLRDAVHNDGLSGWRGSCSFVQCNAKTDASSRALCGKLPAWVLRGLSGIAALVMIVLGIYSAIGNLTSFDLPTMIKCIWFTLFGLLLLISEARELAASQWLLGNMEFLLTFFGRGVFCVYVGTLCIGDDALANSSFGSTVVGLVLCGVGVFNVAYGMANGEDKPAGYDEHNQAVLNP